LNESVADFGEAATAAGSVNKVTKKGDPWI
jgi:hypothetical protein